MQVLSLSNNSGVIAELQFSRAEQGAVNTATPEQLQATLKGHVTDLTKRSVFYTDGVVSDSVDATFFEECACTQEGYPINPSKISGERRTHTHTHSLTRAHTHTRTRARVAHASTPSTAHAPAQARWVPRASSSARC